MIGFHCYFLAALTMEVVGNVAVVIGAVSATVGIINGVLNLLDHRKKMRVSQKKNVVAVIGVMTWVLLAVGMIFIILSMLIHFDIIPKQPPNHEPVIAKKPVIEPPKRDSFPVMTSYHPSGQMGDIGDLISTARLPDIDRFEYEPNGRPLHEWGFKYINGILNEKPAQFAGVMYLNPNGNFGTVPNGGLDLSDVAEQLRWEARCGAGEVNVEFVLGGITWIWDDATKTKKPAPYPDSLPETSLGTKKLTTTWQPFVVDLRERGRVADDFNKTIGGFGWIITWAANGVEPAEDGLSPKEKKVFTIEIRNIRYERK